MWGADNIVTLAKEAMRLDADKEMEAFKTRGGVMGEAPLSAERVKEISKWPSREEQPSILVGQILGPGRNLAAALIAPGGALASQIEQKSKETHTQMKKQNKTTYNIKTKHQNTKQNYTKKNKTQT